MPVPRVCLGHRWRCTPWCWLHGQQSSPHPHLILASSSPHPRLTSPHPRLTSPTLVTAPPFLLAVGAIREQQWRSTLPEHRVPGPPRRQVAAPRATRGAFSFRFPSTQQICFADTRATCEQYFALHGGVSTQAMILGSIKRQTGLDQPSAGKLF